MDAQRFHLGSNYVIKLLQGKWKVSIVCALGIKPMFYGELLNYEREINHAKIAKKVLSEQLNQLVVAKIITRHNYGTIPPKVEYSLTNEGQQLSHTLLQLNVVGERIANNVGNVDFDISSNQALQDHIKTLEH